MENENMRDNVNENGNINENEENVDISEALSEAAENEAVMDEETENTETGDKSEDIIDTAEYSETESDNENIADEENADDENDEADAEAEPMEDEADYPYTLDEESLDNIARNEINKRSKRTLAAVLAGVAAVCIIIAVYCVCVMNGVGTKSVVNTPIAKEDDSIQLNLKYESPVMSLFDSMVFGKGNTTVMKVNDKSVSRSVFEYIVNSSAINYGYSLKQGGKVTDFKKFDWNAAEEKTGLSNAEYVKGGAVESIVPVYALIAEGEKHGIKLSSEEEEKINEWLTQVKGQYGDQFETVLKQSGYENEESLLEMQKLQALMSKVYEDVEKDVSKYATTEQLKAYMDDEKITAKHILIPFEENADEQSKAETKKKAEDILAKIKAGEDFDKLRKENSQDPGQPDAGYTFANDGTMVQEFTDAAFALEPGQVSEIVETSFGYHIIKRVERAASVDEYMDMLRATAKVRIKKSVYDKITVNVNLDEYLGAGE